jgi:hypothetical protein
MMTVAPRDPRTTPWQSLRFSVVSRRQALTHGGPMIRYVIRRPVLLAAALALPAVGLVGGVSPARAAMATFTSTSPTSIGGSSQTVAGAGGVVINDGKASSYPVTTATYVDGLAGTVTDVNLHIDGFSHERPDDVDIMLVSPTGKKSVLLSDIAAGGTAVSDIDLVLDEEAPRDLPLSGGLQSTSYRPRNYYDGPPTPSPPRCRPARPTPACPRSTASTPRASGACSCTTTSSTTSGRSPTGRWS